MSLLSDFEDRVGRAVEGVFAGVFRSPVQPAELARACAKEMDRRRKLGVGKVYAPTVYSILLSPADGEQLGGFSDTLAGELETYLVGYAREKSYQFTARPRVRFLVDDELKLGRFEVIGEFLSPDEIAAELGGADDEAPRGPSAGTDAPYADEPFAGAAPMAAAGVAAAPAPAFFDAESAEDAPPLASRPGAAPGIATVTIRGIEHDVALTGDRMVIGRLKRCDICLPDANASREHAAIEREGAGWVIEDLGSTNGTLLNGERLTSRVRLRDGDAIVIGVSELIYNEPRG